MSPDQIERRVERMMDHLDRLFLTHQIDQETYDKCVADLDQWAEFHYLTGKEILT